MRSVGARGGGARRTLQVLVVVATVLGEGVRCSQSWSRFAWSVEGPRVTTVTVPAKVARNLTRSFFEIAHKRCNSNGRMSQSETCSGELRATLLRLGGHPLKSRPHRHQMGGIALLEARHAEGRLLMVQNPHRQRCSERRWARARPRCQRGNRGERQISFARNLTRSFFEMAHKRCNSNGSFFEIAHKRCNSNGRMSQSEICSGELRATLLRLGGHPLKLRPRRHQTGGIASLEARHAGDTPKGGS